MLALAKRMIRRKDKESIIDAAYSRYASHDVGLPRWFEEDESRHRRCVRQSGWAANLKAAGRGTDWGWTANLKAAGRGTERSEV